MPIADLRGAKSEGAVHRIVRGDARVAHDETGKTVRGAELILTRIGVKLCHVATVRADRDGIFDGECNRNSRLRASGIHNVVSQHGYGKA